MSERRPYGTWRSPISPAVVAAQGLRLGAVAVDGEDIYWIEGRPAEGGRNVLVRRRSDGVIEDVIPTGFNARSRVHEYGGGMFAVSEGVVYFSNFSDQRIYRADGSRALEAVTPEGSWFYADVVVDHRRARLIGVREDHSRGDVEAVNTLVSIPLKGPPSEGDVIASGCDFYSTPRLSPDGARLAWLSWRHPQMPWDGTELWVADVTDSGSLAGAACVAGGPSESIYQPGWSPDGQLYFVSDRDGWWKLYRSERSDRSRRSSFQPVLRQPPHEAEFGRPQWSLGTATWSFASASLIVASYVRRGEWRLATIDVDSGTLADVPTDLEPREWLAATAADVVTVAGNPATPDAVVRISLVDGAVDTIRASATAGLDRRYLSVPSAIEFPTGNGRTAHAFFYPPRNDDETAPGGDRPPLIVVSHGGPTTATVAACDLKVQFWTSRGFAVVDVNYGGSSGYGRQYRQRLNGQWGIVDVEDCVNAARFLAAQGHVHPRRLAIRGGSAGGYTTLAALTFHPDVFAAGASYYGVSDIEVLARDTHKFESRYLDTLVGPYPQAADVYRARSPIHHIDRMSCPLILFQGLEDKVVPPNQSQMMADAVRARGIPVVYLTFAGEQHGFRKAETIVRCLEAELAFYQQVLTQAPANGRTARGSPSPPDTE